MINQKLEPSYERPSTRQDHVRLWAALSDAFVDNTVDYVSIARHLNGYERSTIETVFFLNVAPTCFSNLQAAIPSAWTALDSAWLAETIARNPEARRSSSLRRLHDRAFVADLRYQLKPTAVPIAMAPRASALSAISTHSSSRCSARLKSTPCCTPYKPAAAHQPSLPTASMCKTSGAVVIPQPSGNARNAAIRTVKPDPKAGQQFWGCSAFPRTMQSL